MRGDVSSNTGALKVKLEAVDCYERDFRLRLPFRFGVITVTEGTQAVIRAAVAMEDGRTSVGVAAESLAAKWFDKSPAFSDAQNVDQLRQALCVAIELYRSRGWSTPFGLYADTYRDQLARGDRLGLVPLAASYGPALLDRAILDAVGRAEGLSFAEMIRRNVAGIDIRDELTPASWARCNRGEISPCAIRWGWSIRSWRATKSPANASTTACPRPWRRSSGSTTRATTS
jgi:hypothetical protein